MRSILPLRSLVFPDDFCASRGAAPGRSSIGVNPSEDLENVLSPVLRYKLPALSKSIPPPTWQHSSRWTTTSSNSFLELSISLSPFHSYLTRMFLGSPSFGE